MEKKRKSTISKNYFSGIDVCCLKMEFEPIFTEMLQKLPENAEKGRLRVEIVLFLVRVTRFELAAS